MEIGKIIELPQEKTPAEKLAQLIKASKDVAADPKDWCCASCKYWTSGDCYSDGGCSNETVMSYAGVDEMFFPHKDFGCKCWEAKDD